MATIPSPGGFIRHDVVIVGAGIIGLTVARRLLLESDLSVAVVDAHAPFFGATGAGQGYVWMAHHSPESPLWELACRSKRLWEEFAEGVRCVGGDPLDVLGWKITGSLLVGRTREQSAMLEKKVKLLSQAGLRAKFLPRSALLEEEPALEVGKEGSAAFFPEDCQIDARRAVEFIEQGNRKFALQGRYAEYFDDPVVSLLRSNSNGEVVAVRTTNTTLYGAKAVVIAAGAWTGMIMRKLFMGQNPVPDIPVMPRKGHLLILEGFNRFQLNHGLMEADYIGHQATKVVPGSPVVSDAARDKQNLLSVSMTATMDTNGNLVLGSSREFSGFDKEVDESVVKNIWDRVRDFFPALRDIPFDSAGCKRIRTGLRPYMPDGLPIIGPVPGSPNMFLAAGHEGDGLLLALGTAEMVVDMILGKPGKVDSTPFAYPQRYLFHSKL